MTFLVLGVNGMAGHMIAEYLIKQGHEVTGIARQDSKICKCLVGDVCDWEWLKTIIKRGNYDIVVNAIGVLNKNVDSDISKGIYINGLLPHLLADELFDLPTKLIHISTDCVFDGKKGFYNEQDVPNEQSWYGKSKAIGEVIDDKNLTFRTSIVGPELKSDGIGLFKWFMTQKQQVQGYAKVFWSGVTTLELAKAIDVVATQEITGLYHLVNNQKISKYELLKLFNKYCRKDKVEIIPEDKNISDKTLINTRNDFNFSVKSYEEMVQEMAYWIEKYNG